MKDLPPAEAVLAAEPALQAGLTQPQMDAVAGAMNQVDAYPPLTVMRRRADFLAANHGLRVARPGFVLLVRANGGQGKRFGITVTKRIGNAVVRNRMKRRFRELIRARLPSEGLPDHDHVLIGREGGVERDFALMDQELSAALDRAAQGKGDPPRRGRKGRGSARRADNRHGAGNGQGAGKRQTASGKEVPITGGGKTGSDAAGDGLTGSNP